MHMIIINSVDIANDLLERRSSIYSDRPQSVMATELMGWHWNLSLMRYGSLWRAGRRLFHHEFHPDAALRFRPREEAATHELLRRFVNEPEGFSEHLVHMAGRVILDIAYGIRVQPHGDPYVAAAEAANAGIFEASKPGAFLVDFFTLLKYVPAWVPGAGFQRKAREWKKHTDDVFNLPYAAAKKDYEMGEGESFVTRSLAALEGSDNREFEEFALQGTAASMYNAGVDTTSVTIRTLILAMLRHPDVQVKAQRELDAVVGHGNLPGFEHEHQLPYVGAVIKEVVRTAPILPLSLPHSTTAEDAYEGYRIPAGSIVFANVWAMFHDPTLFPDPSTFRPERFLDAHGQPISHSAHDSATKTTSQPNTNSTTDTRATMPDPTALIFGFGRRVCPGRYLAAHSVWLAAACILAVFDILPVDSDSVAPTAGEGEKDAVTPGLFAIPLPFKARIVPRSDAARAAVLATEGEDGE
ncbi:hypothetical protein PLICRDRAFT_40636 [Plicaturopsis crispa FD-325 SS-3]|nr:hypothetical protein PLICRDRAFT_40636 [Plicaturopsis crispa FD-325 SS-3]